MFETEHLRRQRRRLGNSRSNWYKRNRNKYREFNVLAWNHQTP
jgi:hypothetical protein